MEKQRWKESERRSQEVRRADKRKSEKKKNACARKGRKVVFHCVFPMICGSGWSKSRLAKAAGAEPSDQMRDEKLHAMMARSIFRYISKSKCTKHLSFGTLLKVELSKKCTPLWREAHLEVQSVKNCGFWAFFDIHMSNKLLTNLTNLTNFTNLPNTTNLTNIPNLANIHNLTNSTN